jgi:probable HAF family extracellular repeat protein
MKRIAILITAGTLLAATGMAQSPHYTVIDLGSVGMPPGQPNVITNRGLIAGAAQTAAGTQHAVLWYPGLALPIDIGTPGLNSTAHGASDSGLAVGQTQTSEPSNEDFCAFNAFGFPVPGRSCRAFVWKNGIMTALPTLGGVNGTANMVNNRGEVAGYAEMGIADPDPACPVGRFAPVIWKNGKPAALPAFPGDSDGVAAWINDLGQAVGATGSCASLNPNTGAFLSEAHAMLWEADGTWKDLGNLGGSGGIAGNHACALNNKGQVVGHSELTNNESFHGFLWQNGVLTDLRTYPGDDNSLALGINEAGVVVGASLDAEFTPRALVWQNGAISDLNAIATSGMYLLLAASINADGEIVGLGVAADGLHGFLAKPDRGNSSISERAARPILSDGDRKLVFRRLGIRHP